MAHAQPTIPCLGHKQIIGRIDGLVNKLTLAISAVKNRYCLIHEIHSENSVQLHVRLRKSMLDAVFESEATTEQGRKATLSYNSCTMVAGYFSGIVAFLIEESHLPIAVSEAHIEGVVPAKTVRMYCEEEDFVAVADIHTMLKFTSTDQALHSLLGTGGAYSDSSSWQYWREQGFRKVWSFPVDRSLPNRINDRDKPLGTEYQEQLAEFVKGRSHPRGIDRDQINGTEARIRTINNALYDTIVVLDGPRYISTADDTAWQAAEERLVQAAVDAMRGMELGGNWNWRKAVDTYELKADALLLPGHTAFVSALDSASALDLAELLSQ